MTAPAFRVLARISRRAGGYKGECYESVEKMAAKCHLSKPTVRQAIKYLLARKIIVLVGTRKHPTGKKTNVYKLASMEQWILPDPETRRPQISRPEFDGSPEKIEPEPRKKEVRKVTPSEAKQKKMCDTRDRKKSHAHFSQPSFKEWMEHAIGIGYIHLLPHGGPECSLSYHSLAATGFVDDQGGLIRDWRAMQKTFLNTTKGRLPQDHQRAEVVSLIREYTEINIPWHNAVEANLPTEPLPKRDAARNDRILDRFSELARPLFTDREIAGGIDKLPTAQQMHGRAQNDYEALRKRKR